MQVALKPLLDKMRDAEPSGCEGSVLWRKTMPKNMWSVYVLALSLTLPVSLPAPANAVAVNMQVGSNGVAP